MCDCIDQANKALDEHNCYIERHPIYNRAGKSFGFALLLPLKKIKPSKKPLPTIWAKHCPICGEKFGESK
jgi:hypothetical protein